MMVLINEACPGQSTKVNWICSYCEIFGSVAKCAGMGRVKEEKPRSRVIPRCCDCGFLSNAAVDSDVERERTRDVLPASTWPKMPTFILRILLRSAASVDMTRNKPRCGNF